MTQTWNAERYAQNGRFVAESAHDLIALLDAKAGHRILDLGCGDGFLTQKIADLGADVTGIDAAPDFVAAACRRGLDIRRMDGQQLCFSHEFDAVFSNAALHWMPDQAAVLRGVRAALKPGGRFVAELGGHGNIAAIRTALSLVVAALGVDAEAAGANVFFTPEEYRALLDHHGFRVDSIALIPRPTPLPTGMRNWLLTFRRGLLDLLPIEQQIEVLDRVEMALRPVLCDSSGRWTADYVRLRFHATAL